MRGVSQETRQLLQQLGKRAPRIFGRNRHLERQIELLREIGDRGEPAAISDLHPYLLQNASSVARQAAATIGQLLGAAEPGDLMWLDQNVRNAWWYGYRSSEGEARRFETLALERLGHDPDVGVAVVAVASLHPNGHIREAAIRLLRERHDGSELPYLLVRLTDWVGQVWMLAHEAVLERLVPDYISHFVDLLEVVTALPERDRARRCEATQGILRLLATEQAASPLREAIESRRRRQRRAALRLLLEHRSEDLDALAAGLAGNPDSIIRLQALREAVKNQAVQEQTLRTYLTDKFAPLRGLALAELLEREPDDVRELATDGLMDRAASVRREAQWYLQRTGGFGLHEFYLERLIDDGNRVVRTALRGLGQIADDGAAREVAPFLESKTPSLVRTAIEVLSKLGKGEYDRKLAELVFSDQPSVSKAARRALTPRVQRLGAAELAQKYHQGLPDHVRESLVVLFAQLDKWDALPALLRFAVLERGDLRERALSRLWRWHYQFNRSQVGASAAQLEEARTWMSQARAVLPEGLFRELAGMVDAGRR